jgi:hypothetical protein
MTVIYCHNCAAWSLFNDLKCQVCQVEQNFNTSDPSSEELFQAWGMPDQLLGRIDVLRQQLPRIGCLIACAGGLAFIPELEQSTVHYVDHFSDGVTKQSLIRKLWNSQQPDIKLEELANIQSLHPHDIWQIPGSFFVSWNVLEKFVFHQKIWSIQMENQRAYTFQVLTPLPLFTRNITELATKKGLLFIVDQR